MEIVLEALPKKLLQLLQLLLKKSKEATEALLDLILELLNPTKQVLKGFKESVLEPLQEKLLQLLLKKSKEATGALLDPILELLNPTKQVLKGFKESVLEPLQEKLLQLFLKMEPWLPTLWTKVAWLLVGKLEEVLPSYVSSSNTLLVWVQFFMAVALIRVAFWLTYFLLYFLLCVMRAFRVAAAKMMKAPGRKGKIIRRAVFENDPRGYFRGLRAEAPLGRPKRPSKMRWLSLGALVAGVVVVVVKSW